MIYTAAPLVDRAAACRALAPAQSTRTDASGRWDLAALVRRGAAYEVRDESGRQVAAYLVEASNGALWITAAAGRAPHNLVAVLAGLVEHQARACGFKGVGFRTERRGLVRKAGRVGFVLERQDGNEYFLRKTIQ